MTGLREGLSDRSLMRRSEAYRGGKKASISQWDEPPTVIVLIRLSLRRNHKVLKWGARESTYGLTHVQHACVD